MKGDKALSRRRGPVRITADPGTTRGPAATRSRPGQDAGPAASLGVPAPRLPLLPSLSSPFSWAHRSTCRGSPTCARTSRTCTDDSPWSSPPLDVRTEGARIVPLSPRSCRMGYLRREAWSPVPAVAAASATERKRQDRPGRSYGPRVRNAPSRRVVESRSDDQGARAREVTR